MNNEIVQLSEREHIINRPSMYIGSVDEVTTSEYIYEDNKIQEKNVTYVPGLLKIINEIIDNSVDVAIKSNFKYSTNISIKMDDNYVEVQDDGTGIPNKESNGKLMPELAWGHARSGSNFKNDSSRVQIGLNGIGSFATNCFSKKFVGISDDGTSRVTLTWNNNAETLDKVKKEQSKSTGVNVKFYPDLAKFKLGTITESHKQMIYQRLMNLKMSFPEINFKFNGKKINVSTFKKFIQLFTNSTPELIETDNYSYAIINNPNDDFRQYSYVNGLKIPEGGTHISVLTDNIVNRIRDKLIKKYKTIKPADIRNKLFVVAFLKNFPNAKFNSQTKEKITNSISELTTYLGDIDYDSISKKILKNASIMDPITEVYKLKEEFKRRQELKSLNNTPKKIKNEKYFPSTKDNKYLLIVEGDCLEQNTEVLLSDYSTKPIRNLKVGDVLIGSNLAKTTVKAQSSLLKQVMTIKTSAGSITCTPEHRFKVYDTNTNEFKIVDAKTLMRGKTHFKLLRSKINKDTRGLKVTMIGKRKEGFYFLTDTREYITFTVNDVFTIIRNNDIMTVKGTDIVLNDVLLLSSDRV